MQLSKNAKIVLAAATVAVAALLVKVSSTIEQLFRQENTFEAQLQQGLEHTFGSADQQSHAHHDVLEALLAYPANQNTKITINGQEFVVSPYAERRFENVDITILTPDAAGKLDWLEAGFEMSFVMAGKRMVLKDGVTSCLIAVGTDTSGKIGVGVDPREMSPEVERMFIDGKEVPIDSIPSQLFDQLYHAYRSVIDELPTELNETKQLKGETRKGSPGLQHASLTKERAAIRRLEKSINRMVRQGRITAAAKRLRV